tara:strand:- start:462 stop:632 length:171 start_codon:yes stop_codon:yes gene_type:complete
MAKTISRATKMDHRVVFRATNKDIENIKTAARMQGMDCATFLRQMLIQQNVITANG